MRGMEKWLINQLLQVVAVVNVAQEKRQLPFVLLVSTRCTKCHRRPVFMQRQCGCKGCSRSAARY